MKNNKLTNLTVEESLSINGGESLWYWIAYGTSTIIHGVHHVSPSNGGSASWVDK